MNNRMKLLKQYYNLLGHSTTTDDPFSYIINDAQETSAMTLDYLGTKTSVRIPSSIDGYDITEIGPFTFVNHQNITSITIPNSVTQID